MKSQLYMTSSAFNRFWEILGWVFALNEQAFQVISTASGGLALAILVVLLAGLSQAIAQCIILFMNQVKPGRFIFSLLINALLFVAGFLALVVSTWLVTLLPWTIAVPFPVLLTVLGISYAPLLFSFLGALPYFGVPILTVLSIWHLLAMVVGLSAVAGIRLGGAFGYVMFGWVVLQILQQTIGQPIADFGKRLANRVAGVELATNRQALTEMLQQREKGDWQTQFQQRITEVRQQELAATPKSAQATGVRRSLITAATGTAETAAPIPELDPTGLGSAREQGNRTLRTVVGLLAMAILTFLIIVLLRPVRVWWFGWYEQLPRLIRFLFDLAWISVIAIVVAGLLAPLETLGWWAGWYEDEVDTTVNLGELAAPVADPQAVSRYIVYLDGICQSDFKYLPDVEEFLNTLTPTLPDHIALLRGLMVYSVLNNPLDEDRPLAFLWQLADRKRYANPASILGLLINLRNVIIVAVSADKRYGPLYNRGIAQILYDGLIKNGYQPGSSTPVTLIGYSGGGQMSCAAAPYLTRSLSAPVDVISLGGVISANNNFLKLEHLYH